MAQTSEAISSCKCLNVRIRPQPCQESPPQSPCNDSEYGPVYVGDEGISISHPQVTLRTRSRGVPIPETKRCNRYMTLSCLICQVKVYRVLQNIPSDMEGKAGPMLPTDDWAERETLKSATGWIELHRGCLTGDDVANVEKSSSYSPLFSIVLPSHSPTPIEGEADATYVTIPQSSPPHTPSNYLPNLRPILPPAPFTPSHPVFVHLSSLVADKSQALRTDAETYIAELVKEKVAEVEKAENELRSHIEALWRAFREGLGKVEQERSQSSTRTPQRRKDSGNWQEGSDPEASKPSPALVVRDFNPVPSPRRMASPSFAPRVSTLSASLATSTFHHPRAQADRSRSALPNQLSTTNENLRSPPPYSSNPSSPTSSNTFSSLSSPSSKSLSLRASLEGPTYLEPFRRNMNQANDTATSFRYFTILEADASRTQQKGEETERDTSHETPAADADNGTHEDAEASKISRAEKSDGSSFRSLKERSASNGRKAEKEINGASGTNGRENSLKGKRKVTFDVKPEVVTIARDVNAEKKEDERSEEMMFDLEDEGSERGISTSNNVLPLNDPPIAPSRPRRARGAGAGLPSSFSSLRPSSLPAPSAVRPSRTFDTPEDTQAKRPTQTRKKSPRGDVKQATSPPVDEDSESVDPREAEILKLVAADTPSHRGAWKKDSKAWQLFVRRQGGKGRLGAGFIAEEDEDNPDAFATFKDDGDTEGESDSDFQNDPRWATFKSAEIAASLPVSIRPLARTRETLSLASYQPKTSLSDRPGILVPALHPRQKSASGRSVASSAAWRKAAYAERDRSRYMDPGALDFALEEDEDEDDDDDEEATRAADQGGRGRQRALKILQLRSEVPASGMWRSLA